MGVRLWAARGGLLLRERDLVARGEDARDGRLAPVARLPAAARAHRLEPLLPPAGRVGLQRAQPDGDLRGREVELGVEDAEALLRAHRLVGRGRGRIRARP